MVRLKSVAERMTDHRVGHHAVMPGSGKTPHAVHSPCSFEDGAHASIIAKALFPRNLKPPALLFCILYAYFKNCQFPELTPRS
jgi:hypothetical protein